LSKDNYDTWKLQVEALLTKNDLWEYISRQKVKPELAAGADRNALIEAWIIADRKARLNSFNSSFRIHADSWMRNVTCYMAKSSI